MTNLLTNGSFGGGGDRFPEATGISGLMPRGWTLAGYSRPGDPMLVWQDQDWQQSEIIPLQWHQQFPEVGLVYGATGVASDGDTLLPIGKDRWVLKVFRAFSPNMAQFSQTVDAPAGRYRFTCPIYPDAKLKGGDRPTRETSANYYLCSEVAAWMENATAISETGWMDTRSVRIGEYTAITVELQHAGGDLKVGFGVRARWGIENPCWFVDECSLERIDVPRPDPAPTPAPLPPVALPLPIPPTAEATPRMLKKLKFWIKHTAISQKYAAYALASGQFDGEDVFTLKQMQSYLAAEHGALTQLIEERD